jgi:hypothetical protein
MKLYHWDSLVREFAPGKVKDHMPSIEQMLLVTLALNKGENISIAAQPEERMIQLFLGQLSIEVANKYFVIYPNEIIIIPPRFDYRAEAMEDCFAIQLIRNHQQQEDDYLWGV